AGPDLLDGGVDHEVVVLATHHWQCWAGHAAARDQLRQLEVEQAGSSGGLVHGCRPKLRQLLNDVRRYLCSAHMLSTTTGSMRCNASACLTCFLPDTRRAWLPRR